MKPDLLIKFIGGFFIALMLANFLLFIFGVSSPMSFWVVTVLVAVVAYLFIPWLKRTLNR